LTRSTFFQQNDLPPCLHNFSVAGRVFNLLVDDRWSLGGIGRFSQELIRRIDARFAVSKLSAKWHLRRTLNPMNPLWLAMELQRRRPDVFWSPGFMSPMSSPVPFVFSVHDLIHARAVRGMRALYFNSILRPLCRKAYKIVTVSEFSRHEICDWAGLPADRVVPIYDAVANCFTPEGPKFSPTYPYLLYIGVQSAHKNLPTLVRAFAASGLAGECKLLLSGEPNAELKTIAAGLQIADSLVFAGFIPEAELPGYYRGALALVLVSTYEGFGIPPLEAMACGTPVLCSNTTSLPEIVGSAALLVDPADAEGIAEGMRRIVYRESLRKDLISKGFERCSRFSWEDSSKKLCDLLAEAANAH
jgi:glycosyltransferase involved in cell wall biosynthesis